MKAGQVRGIAGLLDGILSSQPRPAHSRSDKAVQSSLSADDTARAVPPAADSTRTAVRRGRPPGKGRVVQPKEKVTVWIERNLLDSYRDWTWQARCQLSHIVERALADYHEQHRRHPGRL